MNKPRKVPPRRLSSLRLDGGSRQTGVAKISMSSIDEREDVSTPLTDIRAQYGFTADFIHPGLQKNESKQKSSKEDTADSSTNGHRQNCRPKHTTHIPEERIKLFAFRLAFIEKASSRIGTLAFLWATVVMLGGFAASLTFIDFWVVAVIIFAEALRIFFRSHELEWQMLKPKEGEESTRSDRGGPALSEGDVESCSTREDSDSPGSSTGMSVSNPRSNKPSRRGDKQSVAIQVPRERHTDSANVSKREPQLRRGLSVASVPLIPSIPVLSNLLKPRVMIIILYILELVSAAVCVGLSLWRLSHQGFCYSKDSAGESPTGSPSSQPPPDEDSACTKQRKSFLVSINLFYSMAVLEAALFLIERGYFEYRMRINKLLTLVKKDLENHFDEKLDLSVFEMFYYTVYTTCLHGSIYDGLEMNLVGFGIQWLQSDDPEKQLYGAKLVKGFVSPVSNGDYQDNESTNALRTLGTTPGIIERLVEMLSWDSKREADLVGEIAAIVCRLVAQGQYGSRFVAVPGALQAIFSLLISDANDSNVGEKDSKAFEKKLLDLRVKGLKILKHLCTSYANSLEIGETRGLLPVLVLFIQPQGSSAHVGKIDYRTRRRIYRKSLKVLYFLAADKSSAGIVLRQQIAAIVSVLKNLRDIIEGPMRDVIEGPMRDIIGDRNGGPYEQLLSMKILHKLALAEDMRCSIGATGGIIRLLFILFRQNDTVLGVRPEKVVNANNDALPVLQFRGPEKVASPFYNELSEIPEDRDQNLKDLKEAIEISGKVLARLMLQNKDNCLTLATLKDKGGSKLPVVDVMIAFLRSEPSIAVSAAEILRSLRKYAADSTSKEIAERSAPIVLQNVFNPTADTKSFFYEASLGLAASALESISPAKSISPAEYTGVFIKGIALSSMDRVVRQLVANLEHSPTTRKVPKVRRYSVEMIMALLERDEYFRQAFVEVNLMERLEMALDSISELENFILVSGLTGCARHLEDMKPLLQRCIACFDRSCSSRPTSPLGSG